MELELQMKSAWEDSEYTYTIKEDTSELPKMIVITPANDNNDILLTAEGIDDLIDVLTMLKSRM